MNKAGKALNGKKTVIGAVVSVATIIFGAVTGQSLEDLANVSTLADAVTLLGSVLGGGFLSVGLGHKFVKKLEGK